MIRRLKQRASVSVVAEYHRPGFPRIGLIVHVLRHIGQPLMLRVIRVINGLDYTLLRPVVNHLLAGILAVSQQSQLIFDAAHNQFALLAVDKGVYIKGVVAVAFHDLIGRVESAVYRAVKPQVLIRVVDDRSGIIR